MAVNLVQKKNTKSSVWLYFSIKANCDNIPIAGEEES